MWQTFFKKDQNLLVTIDKDGWLQREIPSPAKADGCFFILCTAGECTFHIHEADHAVKANDLVCILPKTSYQLTRRSDDCQLYIMGFHSRIIDTTTFISSSMTYLGALQARPVVTLKEDWMELYTDYYRLMEKTTQITDFQVFPDVANHLLLCILHGIIHLHRQTNNPDGPGNRAEEIVRQLVQLIMLNYVEHRSVSFYANLMHLTPQHLSTTVSKVTGSTVTDIIGRFVVNDAQNKLKTTDMDVQEIADSLNFPDLSFFGKYFKRYTGLSPKNFRNIEKK
jgi:AraC-like DNA-binding protein